MPSYCEPTAVDRMSCNPVAVTPIMTILSLNSFGSRLRFWLLKSMYRSEKDTCARPFFPPGQLSLIDSTSGTARPRSCATRAGSEGIFHP